jgi:hypothetical protein
VRVAYELLGHGADFASTVGSAIFTSWPIALRRSPLRAADPSGHQSG